jgi:hypothetical protein
MIHELSARIWSQPRFHQEAATLLTHLLQSRFAIKSKVEGEEEALLRLLRSAAILAASREKQHREMAYQIATAASELESGRYPGAPYLLLLVLSRIGNFPALSYAKQRYSVHEECLPIRAVAEAASRVEGNLVRLGKEAVALTDFQHKLWTELNLGEAVGISAPTSAGKSFILQAYARKLLTERRVDNVAFVVPTRALINQVSEEISDWLRNDRLDVELITTPIPKNSEPPLRGAYIVTQERLQLIQTAHENLSFGLMLIDETQSIADGARGVLLSSVIEEALSRNAKTQLLFAGPNIRDPGKLSALFGKKPRTVRTDEATVTQNVIFVDCDEVKPTTAKLGLLSRGQKVALGSVECDQPLTDHRGKLVNLALRLGRGGQNLIYALGPAECETIAFGLADDEDITEQPELADLSNFVKEAVHPKYLLATSVLRRVGFHYGRLPSLVRKAIEDAFATGQLQFLVTTSTLLYGVNLPAQNLFLHNPQKGQNQPISSSDFWNLAGRAGRLGKEFTGNIFLIDYGDWLSDPLSGDKEQVVKPAIEEHIVDRLGELVDYINDPSRVPDREKQDELENTFVKLVRDKFDGKLDATLDRVGLPTNDPTRTLLVKALEASVANTNINRDTLLSSPTVSIHRQQSLYTRLHASLNKHGPAYVIPKHPADSKAYQSYVAAIKRCHDEVMKFPKTDRSHAYYAQVALRWMRGEPLPQIIDENFKYKQGRGENPNIATVIRETLNEVERDLRFKYVRLFSCYNAVLELVLHDNKMDELISSIPSIPMYLEVGACSPTMISFMGLGLSRYTAGKLRQLPRRTEMSQQEARSWLLRQDLQALNLPSASIQEIQRLVFAT